MGRARGRWLSAGGQVSWPLKKLWRRAALGLHQEQPQDSQHLPHHVNVFVIFYKNKEKKVKDKRKKKKMWREKLARHLIHQIGNYCGSSDNNELTSRYSIFLFFCFDYIIHIF